MAFPIFNRYQHPFGHTSGASEIILTDPNIDLWREGKSAPGQNPPVISPPVIFRRIGVRAEIQTQNPVLSNTASQDGTTKPSPPTAVGESLAYNYARKGLWSWKKKERGSRRGVANC
jgi:hypothetical protein